MNEIKKTNKSDLLHWYAHTFIPDPERGYALMCPPGARAKYARKNTPCTTNLIMGALNNATRRLSINDSWETFAVSLAITPQHREGWATMATIDVDGGGENIIKKALSKLQELGLWAFGQLGKSAEHSGGHIYIPSQERLPVGILSAVATEIMQQCEIIGEAYPCNRDLRLPLMTHLHAPGGARRYPLMLQNGITIDAADPWAALTTLRTRWQTNDPEAMTAIIPTKHSNGAAKAKRRQPVHKSKVRPSSIKSVINWYNARYDLAATLGVERGMITCPWHDDKRPSLGVWQHDQKGTVCQCLSQHSNCPAAEARYWDAFNLYCWENNCTPEEAVKQISKEHGLGQRRRFRIQTTGQKEPCTSALVQHMRRVDETRKALRKEIDRASKDRGTVTIIKATPGTGKTHASAELANRLQNQGKTVAIVAPSHENASQEWAPKIHDAFIWQSRAKLCTCHEASYLQTAANLGYTVPKCEDKECPYLRQYEQRKGKITIYQHNHTYINNGALLEDYEVIIIDESIAGALLEERRATIPDLVSTMNHLRRFDSENPAIPIIEGLVNLGLEAQKERTEIPGDAIAQALADSFGGREPLEETIKHTQTTHTARLRPLAPPGVHPGNLRPQFLGRLLEALLHDLHSPANNPLLHFIQSEGEWSFSWSKRHSFLAGLQGQFTSPAVIILDGSASELVYKKLLSPWQVKVFELQLPPSPLVNVIQCTATSSTRKIVHDEDIAARTIRQVQLLTNELDLTLDGGIAYKHIKERCEQELGGHWLHYGGQRGSNALAGAKTIALLASPTTNQNAVTREAQALFHDEPRLSLELKRQAAGYYTASDPRLEAVNRIHSIEELHQAFQRSRPTLAHSSSTILVCSPWPLTEFGIVARTVIEQLPHGNSTQAQEASKIYCERMGISQIQGDRADWGGGDIGLPARKSANSIRGLRVADREAGALPHSISTSGSSGTPSLIKTGLKSAIFLQPHTHCKPNLPVTTAQKNSTIPPPNQPSVLSMRLLDEARAVGYPDLEIKHPEYFGRTSSGLRIWKGFVGAYEDRPEVLGAALESLGHLVNQSVLAESVGNIGDGTLGTLPGTLHR